MWWLWYKYQLVICVVRQQGSPARELSVTKQVCLRCLQCWLGSSDTQIQTFNHQPTATYLIQRKLPKLNLIKIL